MIRTSSRILILMSLLFLTGTSAIADKSKEEQDVKSKGMVYVKLEADKSSITWGNYNTKIHNSDLVEYDKSTISFILLNLIVESFKLFIFFKCH